MRTFSLLENPSNDPPNRIAVSLQDICTRLDELGTAKWKSKDDCSRSGAIFSALDQGIEFGFIVGDNRRRTFKLGVNYFRFENYHFNNKLQMLSDDIAQYGLNKILCNKEHLFQSDISDDSTEFGDEAAYDTDDERTPTPKKKKIKLDETASRGRAKRRTFSGGSTPKRTSKNAK